MVEPLRDNQLPSCCNALPRRRSTSLTASGSSSTFAERAWLALPIAAGLAFVLLAAHAARLETPTIDEFAHVPAGFFYLDGGTFDLYAKNPPLMQALLALPGTLGGGVVVPEPQTLSQSWGPWIYGGQFMSANAERYLSIFAVARGVVIACVCATALLLFVWARSLFGLPGAAVATSLFLLCPMILGHGHLATVDIGCTAALFAASFGVRWATLRPSLVRMSAAGALVGVALLTKFTALLMLPLFVLLVLYCGWEDRRRALLGAGVLGMVALFVVNAGMVFDGSFRSLGDYAPKSEFVTALRHALPGWLPVPLPEAYATGFDAVRFDTERGEFGSYLLGEWTPQGRWYYNLVAFAVKTPLPLIAMLIVSPWFLRRSGMSRRDAAFLLGPPLLLLVLLAGFNSAGIGLRYLLPVYPFLFLMVASLWTRLSPRWAVLGAMGAVGYYAVVVAAIHPAYLGYFNVAAGGPAQGHRYLVDSNLDWGQDLYRLAPALEELGVEQPVGLLYFGHVHPRLYGLETERVPSSPSRGVFAVSVSFLMGNSYVAIAPDGKMVSVPRDAVSWLREREPVKRIGSIWIYDTREAATESASDGD